MPVRIIIPPRRDPRLGRIVRHDTRSRMFAHPTDDLKIQTVEWPRVLPILDQGNVGSCTADATFGLLGTEMFYDLVAGTVVAAYGSFDQAGAYRFYSAEEYLDGDGPYPPQDNGSSGLSAAMVARNAGIIPGWTQTFSLDAMLRALSIQPMIVGTTWLQSMFTPNAEGILTLDFASDVAGGHEYLLRGYDSATGLLKFDNSWGAGFGKAGSFFIPDEAFGKLLADHGDTTIFARPAPVAVTA